MNKRTLRLSIIALTMAALLGVAGMADAYGPWGKNDMSPEQHAAMQEMYAESGKTIQPLQQQLYAKQAELDALYYKDTPLNDPAVQALKKEVNDLDAKLYAAHAELRAKMDAKGIPYGRGAGLGYGRHGRGMSAHNGYGGCCSW
ncbi:MAG: hypothetical protein ZNDK_0235 [Candidatus Desulfovibrio kirbyi]|uniref:Zinc resistance-associated protein n=1 Tax=Candidatus Desulfovibrio kirbyi TaxID=2696086 RepID=A0A6L2R4T9_9BACT|nr:MAG: hypothetical protein ZNDK_0235 [Candidatus Desulfovibrio kirbyi]